MKTLFIPISVGYKYFERINFNKIKDYVIRNNFTQVNLVIADTLQHYTIMAIDENIDKETAIKISEFKGINWHTKNKNKIDILSQNGITTNIFFWKNMKTSKVPESLDTFIEEKVTSFYDSMIKKHPNINREHFFGLSRQYVKEEVGVLLNWYQEHGEFTLYYPKEIGIAFEMTNKMYANNEIKFTTTL